MDSREKIFVLNRRHRHKNKRPGLLTWLLLGTVAFIFLITSVAFLATVGAIVGVYAYYAKDLPDPEAIETEQEEFETTKIYDRYGNLLHEVFDPKRGDRTYVPLQQIPLYMRQATIAIEDRSFYTNLGINLRGLARALLANLQGESIQGGSSITQQLVKNVLIPSEERYQRLYSRKIKETIMALEITRRYPGVEGKDQILEWYLNTVFYGSHAYGVEAAAQVYFGKHIWELDLAECAMLAALPQFPGLTPIHAPEEAKKRQKLVLEAMVQEGYITPAQAEEAGKEELRVKPVEERFDINPAAAHFALYVQDLLEEKYGPDMVARGGLRVYTTLDPELQRIAQEAARKHIKELEEDKKKDYNVHNAAVVIINPRTGEILAMVGSLDYKNKEIDGQVNVALAPRQPGSAFKPFTYVTALAQGHTLATMVMDVRICPNPFDPSWCPENYDRKYHGPQRMRLALARSYNIPAVKFLDMVGVGNVIKTAHRMGINTLNRDLDFYGLSLTLGGGEVTLLDMTYAYSVFATGGVMNGKPIPPDKVRPGYRELNPVSILRVEDRNGNVLEEFRHPKGERILSEQLAYLMNTVLSDNQARVAAFGANNALQLKDRPAAVKTGTTDDFRDAWCIGWTPQIAVGVWVGNSDNEPMNRLPGSRGAAPIWNEIMEKALSGKPVETWEEPPGLKRVQVCSVSGLLPTEHCPHKVWEIFIEGTEPTTYCDIHQVFRINRETGKLATVYTPPELVEEKVYEIYPPEAADWVRESGIEQPPKEYDTIVGTGPVQGDVAIISPPPYAYIRGGVVITGNAKGPDFQLYRLEYGEGLNPSAWIQIGGDHYEQRDNAPLEYWEVSGLNGLYTLQLSVIDRNQNYRQAAIQVTVDNIPPQVKVEHPEDGALYIMEKDEYVNIKADASDNVSMDKVEYYLDNKLINTTTVAPYNQKWTITMSDTIPIPGHAITWTEFITGPDGIPVPQVITYTQVFTEEAFITDTLVTTYTQVFSDGMMVISSTLGYTESHLIHVIAYDAAGNKTESEKVRIYVAHKPPKEKKEEASEPEARWLGPWLDSKKAVEEVRRT
ncbi:MAG: penicillin-binding protein [Anaerolineae bacterium]